MADIDVHYDPVTVNSGGINVHTDPITVDVKGLDDTKNTLVFETPQPVRAESVLDLRLPQPLRTDSRAELILAPIRTDSTATVDLQPVVLDQCVTLRLAPVPPTCVRQPYQQRFGVTFFGIEVAGWNVSGESQIHVHPIAHGPHIEGNVPHQHPPHREAASSRKTSAPFLEEGASMKDVKKDVNPAPQSLRIRLGS